MWCQGVAHDTYLLFEMWTTRPGSQYKTRRQRGTPLIVENNKTNTIELASADEHHKMLDFWIETTTVDIGGEEKPSSVFPNHINTMPRAAKEPRQHKYHQQYLEALPRKKLQAV